MFNNLVESRRKGQRKVGSTVFSFVMHYGLIALAIYATANAAQEDEKPKEEKVDFVEVKKEEPPKPKEPPPPEIAAVPPPPKGFQMLTAPVEIPNVLPDIDLTRAVTNEADFTGRAAGRLCQGDGEEGRGARGPDVLRVPGGEAGHAGSWIRNASVSRHPAPGRRRRRSAGDRSWWTRPGGRNWLRSRSCGARTSSSPTPCVRRCRACGSSRPKSAGRKSSSSCSSRSRSRSVK